MPDYVHPEVLVSTEWVAEHLSDPQVRIVESDEDRALYTQGHIPGAVEIDWAVDLPWIPSSLADGRSFSVPIHAMHEVPVDVFRGSS